MCDILDKSKLKYLFKFRESKRNQTVYIWIPRFLVCLFLKLCRIFRIYIRFETSKFFPVSGNNNFTLYFSIEKCPYFVLDFYYFSTIDLRRLATVDFLKVVTLHFHILNITHFKCSKINSQRVKGYCK